LGFHGNFLSFWFLYLHSRNPTLPKEEKKLPKSANPPESKKHSL